MAPSARNPAAIRSYQKAKFEITEDVPTNFIPDYDDTVIMIRTFPKLIELSLNQDDY